MIGCTRIRCGSRTGGPFSFGVQLCEDMWCEDYCHNGEPLDTLALYRRRGAEAVFNLSSSPFYLAKKRQA